MSSRLKQRPAGTHADPGPGHGAVRQGGHVAEMQRSRLMLAIVEVTGESGLEAATVGRVCEQAGVSRRTFYELYEVREACLLAAFDRLVMRLEESVRSEFEGEGSWRARTRRALAALLECLDAEPHVTRVCVIEALRAGPRLVEHRGRVLNALAAAIDEGRAEVRVGAEPPPLTARGVAGGVLSVIHARLLEPPSNGSTRPLVALTSSLMAMIVHPYLGAPAARKELERPEPVRPPRPPCNSADPFKPHLPPADSPRQPAPTPAAITRRVIQMEHSNKVQLEETPKAVNGGAAQHDLEQDAGNAYRDGHDHHDDVFEQDSERQQRYA
jgi:AcrR family transcriptional regulator